LDAWLHAGHVLEVGLHANIEWDPVDLWAYSYLNARVANYVVMMTTKPMMK